MFRVSEINIYPVKSCAGTRLTEAPVQEKGLENDRRWMVVNSDGVALTQRDVFKMALIKPELPNGRKDIALKLSAPGFDDFELKADAGKRDRSKVEVWGDVCDAIDQGDGVADWFSNYLERKCRLVEMASDFMRIVDQDYAVTPANHVSFADGFPLLLISEESLADLNSRLDAPILMNRFRPNVVVAGCDPYAEDTWATMKIGKEQFAVVKPCARCVITTIDQATGTLTGEPLRTLAQYRSVGNKLMFGQNVIPQSTGRIRVGDEITVLSKHGSAA